MSSEVDALIKKVASDRDSGATQIAIAFAEALIAYCSMPHPEPLEAMREDLRRFVRAVIMGQPSMAPLVHVANDALIAVGQASTTADAIDALSPAIRRRHDLLSTAQQGINVVVRATLGEKAHVVTISRSSAVAQALVDAQRAGCALSVVCLESRPRCEGRGLAEQLVAAGIGVSLTVDAAMYQALEGAGCWLAGADSLTENGAVNKLGTAALAACAQAVDVPGYVVADMSKLWPAALPLPRIDRHAPAEVWADAPDNVHVDNMYFERVPWDSVTGVLTQEGAYKPEAIVARCRALPVHADLRALLAH